MFEHCGCQPTREKHEIDTEPAVEGHVDNNEDVCDLKAWCAFARSCGSSPSSETSPRQQARGSTKASQQLSQRVAGQLAQFPHLVGKPSADTDGRYDRKMTGVGPGADPQRRGAKGRNSRSRGRNSQGKLPAVGTVPPLRQISPTELGSSPQQWVEPSPQASHGGLVKSNTQEVRDSISLPARFMGAKAAVRERPCLFILSQFLVGYRVLEITANCGLIAILLWWVQPYVLIFPFLLLWYIPAVFRTGYHSIYHRKPGHEDIPWWRPWVGPLYYPVLLFVADDFSWMRIHPLQRGAFGMYAIYILRVSLMLVVIPLCSPHGGLSGACRAFINEDSDSEGDSPLKRMHEVFYKVLTGSTLNLLLKESDHPDHFLTVFWAATAEVIMCMSAFWVVGSVIMVGVSYGGTLVLSSRNEVLLNRIDCIARAIEVAALKDDPVQCRRVLENLPNMEEAEGGCMTFEFTTPFHPGKPNPLLVGVMSTFHFLLRGANIYTYGSTLTVNGMICSSVLLVHLVMTIVQKATLGTYGPCSIWKEIKDSLDRGLFTSKLFELMKTDKGVLTLPALVFTLSSLPWTVYTNGHSDHVQMLQAVGQVLGFVSALVGTGVFTFQQFDLGIEREGQGYAPRQWSSL